MGTTTTKNGMQDGNQTLQRQSSNYSEVELSQEETDTALKEARKKKFYDLKTKEYYRMLNTDREPLKVTTQDFENYILNKNKNFVKEFQPEQFKAMIDYFMGESKQGLLLFGGVGCGKTTLIKIFHFNPKQSYAVLSCRDVAAAFVKDGHEGISKYYGQVQAFRSDFQQTDYGICFDDLGEEKNKKFFGNELNVMEDIIESRYTNKNLWSKTHITTNLLPEQIEEVYGKRVRSRMKEMFQVINFTGISDLRGNI